MRVEQSFQKLLYPLMRVEQTFRSAVRLIEKRALAPEVTH